MALDKLVDSTQLDADLTSVANAIRTKGGTSAQLAFPAGFVSAVQAIPSGSDITVEAIAKNQKPSGPIVITGTTIGEYAFACKPITNVQADNVTSIGTYAFHNCTSFGTAIFPLWQGTTTSNNYTFQKIGNGNAVVVLPALKNAGSRMFTQSKIKAVDIGPNFSSILADTFYQTGGSQVTKNLILRRTAGVVTASTTDSIKAVQNLWVPEALVDSYKAATNWSTRINGGYITVHAIEGSIYENAYADGTPIPTT